MSARTSATIQQTDHGGMMRAGMPPDRIALARDPCTGVEAIHASFSGHAYDLHRHDEWLVGVTDRGLQNFFCRGKRHTSSTGTVILIEPGPASPPPRRGRWASHMKTPPDGPMRVCSASRC
jgi:hypothetical protein